MVVADLLLRAGQAGILSGVDGPLEDAYIGLEVRSNCDRLGGHKTSFFD